ncbi:MAG: DNRLRE domain-containing protein [Actinomycetota bacterium]|nr:DNRLRE domain-containing protein [Actinomycetota bacterium]
MGTGSDHETSNRTRRGVLGGPTTWLAIAASALLAAVPAFTDARESRGTRTADPAARNQPATPRLPGRLVGLQRKHRVEVRGMRTIRSRTFLNRDGTISRLVGRGPINYRDGRGRLRPLDPSLERARGGGAELRGTSAVASVAAALRPSRPVATIETTAGAARLRLVGASGARARLRGGEVTFRDALPGIDLAYSALPQGLKEDIVVRRRGGPATFEFELTLPGARVEERRGELIFRNRESGRQLLVLPKPHMYDNADAPSGKRAVSQDVHYRVRPAGTAFRIEVVADRHWLRDRARRLPIVIDPTIVKEQTYYDTYVSSCAPTTSYYNTVWMLGGWRGCYTRSFLSFANLPEIPYGGSLTDAKLRLHQYEVVDPAARVNIFKVTTPWNATAVTWNSQPGWTGADASSFVDPANESSVLADVTAMVRSWYAGSPNHGMLLAYANELQGGRTWRTGNFSADPNQWPKLLVTYSAPYSSQCEEPDELPPLAVGEQREVTVRCQNTGTRTWYPDGQNPVRLGTDAPRDRGSGFHTEDGRWIGSNRIRLDQQSVAPGDWGSFTFTVTANANPGTYPETFRVVADGWAWLEDPVTLEVAVVAKSYGSQWQGQGALPSLAPCESATAWTEIKNTGNVTWRQESARLGTSAPLDRTSRFATTGDWLSPNRPTAIDQATVPPGGVARFTFTLTVPCDTAPGTYNEYVRPVIEGVTWLTDQGIHFPVRVEGRLRGVDSLGQVEYAPARSGVNPATGNLFLTSTDLSLTGRGGGLTIARAYNSASPEPSLLGRGWWLDFEQRLAIDQDTVTWIAGDGQRFAYVRNADGTFAPPDNTYVKLARETDGTYTLTDKKNLRLRFSAGGRLESVVDRNGNAARYEYDGGRLAAILDPSDRRVSLAYDPDGRITAITDFAERTIRFEHAGGQLVKATDASGAATSYSYDGAGRLTDLVDARGNRTRYEYDSAGRVVAITDAKQLAEPAPAATRFAYDTASQTTVTDPKGAVTVYGIDGRGAVTRVRAPDGATEYTAYDRSFNRIAVTTPKGGQRHMAYDGSGNLVRSSDELGAVTSSTFDADYGNVLSTTSPNGVQQKLEYDASGNLTREYADFTNEPAKFTEHTYDPAGNKVSTTDPLGNRTAFEYDAHGRVVREVAPPASAPRVTEYAYDAAGNRLSVKDPEGGISQTTYNENNQPTSQTDATGRTSQTAYDATGNVTGERDAAGNVTTYQYDQLGQVTRTTSPDPQKAVSYSYDAVGNVTSSTAGNGATTATTYDATGRPTKEVANGVETQTTYDVNGDVTKMVEGAGTPAQATTSLTLDPAGQVKAEATNGLSTVRYGYDANGNTTSTTDGSGTIATVFDGNDQPTRESQPGTPGTAVQYDANGNVTQVTTPAGKTTTYAYDANEQVKEATVTSQTTSTNQNVVDPVVRAGSSTQAERSSLEHDANGNLTRLTSANGDVTAMTYDAASRVTGLTTTSAGGGAISRYTYAYDASGNVARVEGDGVTTVYGYDSLNQLLGATDDRGRAWTYMYDAGGNRTQAVEPSGTTSYGYGDATDRNRLVWSSKDGGTPVTYSYDGRGNNTGRSDGTSIAYDGDNAITRAKIGSGPEVSYAYDAQKRMTARTAAGQTVHYQYEGDRLTAELDAAGAVLVTYAYDDRGRPLSQTRNDITAPNDPSAPNKVYYYHHDNRGNVTSLTDPAGVVVKRYTYDPYGKVVEDWDRDPAKPIPNPFTYSGYWQDPATKLYHLKARWYDASLGRFLSVDPDPSNDDGTLDAVLNANLYLYTNNNPVLRVDPDGTGFGILLAVAARVAVRYAPVVVATAARLLERHPRIGTYVSAVNHVVRAAWPSRHYIAAAAYRAYRTTRAWGGRAWSVTRSWGKQTVSNTRTWWRQKAAPRVASWGRAARTKASNAWRWTRTKAAPQIKRFGRGVWRRR